MRKKGMVSLLKTTALNITVLGSLALLSTGCLSATRAIGIDTSSNAEQDKLFVQGKYAQSAKLAYDEKDRDAEIDNDNLLPTLKAGNAYFCAQDYNATETLLDEAEAIIKYQREQIMLGSVADYAAKLMLSDAAVEYYATITDSVMVNTYKSLALMSEHKFDDARVELNRAIDRQRRAKEVYAKLIGKQKELIEEKTKSQKTEDGFDMGSVFAKTLNNEKTKQMIDEHYSNLKNFQAYPDFINPFTTYLAGLYFRLNGDYKKSVDLLKEASGMMPKNKVIATDFREVDRALSGRRIKNGYVWVIFANGLAPKKEEFRIDIPVFLFSNNVQYVGIALPEFRQQPDAYPYLNVASNGVIAKTELVADMDRVILTEFKYAYNDIVTRAILSAALKAFAQYQAQRTGGGYLSMAMGALSALTTHADTRTWSTLPKNFQVARVPMPKDGLVKVTMGSAKQQIKVDKNAKNAIVYVRVPTAMSIPSVSVVNFK